MEKFNPEWAKDVPCRNIIIYGYCKKQKEGCPFKHDNDPLNSIQQVDSTSNTNTIGSAISTTTSTNSNSNIGAAVQSDIRANPNTVQLNSSIMPSLMSLSSLSKKNPQTQSSSHKFNAKISESFTPVDNNNSGRNFDAYHSESFTPTSTRGNPLETLEQGNPPIDTPQMAVSPRGNMFQTLPNGPVVAPQVNAPGQVPVPLRYPTIYPPPHSILQYHLYAQDPPPHLQLPLKPNERTPDMLFLPNDIRENLLKKNLAALQTFPPGGALPDIVQDYFCLVPLDFHQKSTEKDRYNTHKNSLYKVFSNTDGKLYVLRRIHGIKQQLEPSLISSNFKRWNSLHSANIIHLHDCFLTTAFGDSSLCFIYDYYPDAISLYEFHFVNFPLVPITQDCLWVYLIQLCNAIKTVHSNKLIVSNLDWEKILVTGSPRRIKISTCNEIDPLLYGTENDTDLQTQQQQDFVKLGELLYKLASQIQNEANETTGQDDEVEKLNIDAEFKAIIRYLLSKEILSKSIKELTMMFAEKIYLVFEAQTTYVERMESVLSHELENGRLFRLMCKLNFIFGRVESRIDINWSESGDKFAIILFYDYVFHQVDPQGKSVMDLTHVLRCLNKLDAGVNEKLVLATPDEMTCIIISYKELKELINTTFRSLTQ
ncbi:PAB-dependent poly(A)-specific ribonuclease subunit 3 [Maudiozyma exigua]|uniref:PAN2-PAN3 deadenylation complex subunit PAN3 n=1 Tax=Maudiozyma exigua TaxID=34358 RepID=A0A9P6WDQ5_MAUEX|nr:PAB-dependent poly(A)-specific ribonuclease subunit 3 [Kazachstania exigua]